MKSKYLFFLNVLSSLDHAGVLPHLMLIGSWCLYAYRQYFDNAPEIPLLRTADIDFLIPRPFKMENKIDAHKILLNLGFDEQFSLLNGHIKYVHPQLEVEFLTPELGKGSSKPFTVHQLNLHAQRLRYLTLLQDYPMHLSFESIDLIVPQPSAFVLHKLLLSDERRNDSDKRLKDLRTAIELGQYLLTKEYERNRLIDVFNTIPLKWQSTILKVSQKADVQIYQFLTKIKSR